MDQLFYNFVQGDQKFLSPRHPTSRSASLSSSDSTDDDPKVVLRSSRKRSLSSSHMQSFAEHVSDQLRRDAMTKCSPTISKDDSACQPYAKRRRIEDVGYLCSINARSLLLHQSTCHSEIAAYQSGVSTARLELNITRPPSLRGKGLVAFMITDASQVKGGVTRFSIPATSCSYFNRFNGIWGIIELDSDVNAAETADFSESVLRCLIDAYSRRYTDCVLTPIRFHGACATPRSDIHANVFEIADLVHRNIGVDNLLVTDKESPVIVDWDLAQEYDASSLTQTSKPFYCIGVKTFAAKEVLQFRSRLHLYRYDLESFVWTLVWFLDCYFAWSFHLTGSQRPRHWHESTFKDAVQGKKRILNILSGRVSGSACLIKRGDWVNDFKERVVTVLKRIQYDRGRVKRLRNERLQLVGKFKALAKVEKGDTATGPDAQEFSPEMNELEGEFLLNTRQLISGDDGFNTDEFLEALHDTQKFPNRMRPVKVSLPRYKIS